MPRPLRIEYPGACNHVICRTRYSLSAIAEQLGPLTISGLASARSKKDGGKIKNE